MKATGHRELPIIFTAESVRAILAGRKSQTRRLINPQPNPFVQQTPDHHPPKRPEPYLDAYCGEPKTSKNPRGMGHVWCWWTRDNRLGDEVAKSRFIPGDRLWVKEAWGAVNLKTGYSEVGRIPGGASAPEGLEAVHAATASDFFQSIFEPRWRSPLYMPRWASRLTLEVTEVRAQRVQDISEEDAKAEGMRPHDAAIVFGEGRIVREMALTHRGAFACAWDRINGKRSPWSHNDFVFAYTFRRIEK